MPIINRKKAAAAVLELQQILEVLQQEGTPSPYQIAEKPVPLTKLRRFKIASSPREPARCGLKR